LNFFINIKVGTIINPSLAQFLYRQIKTSDLVINILSLVPVDELLWSPSSLNDITNENINEYLKTIRSEC
jgi:hypothetical protein